MKNLPLLPEKHFHKDILKNPLADFLASIYVIILSCLGNIVPLDSRYIKNIFIHFSNNYNI